MNSLLLESERLKNLGVCTVEQMVETYNATLSEICNGVSPIVIKNVRERNQQVWYTEELQTEKLEKRKAERKYLKHRNENNRAEYKRQCDKYYLNIKETKSCYYKNVISEKKNDIKAVYGLVNKLSGDGNQNIYPKMKPEKEIANEFAQFFSSKISDIRKEIADGLKGVPENTDCRSNQTAVENVIPTLNTFAPVSIEALNSVYNGMKKKNYAKDPIPIRAHSRCFESIQPFMLEIVNKSLFLGEFPSNLKHATVTPLIKDVNGNHEDYKNYRPVHNTPLLAKLIEKCVFLQLNDHLQENNLHTMTQSGYKKYHSCETALIKVVNDIQIEKQQNNITVVLMLDQSAAFDTVDLPTIITKLERGYNITGKALKWISSYLLGRTYSVIVNNVYG